MELAVLHTEVEETARQEEDKKNEDMSRELRRSASEETRCYV